MMPFKKQKQSDKQKLIQIQNQSLSNSVMACVLSTAECYAIIKGGYSGERKYGAYDYFDSLSNKSRRELEEEFSSELYTFQKSFTNYSQNYGGYNFPSNLTKKEILLDIKNWKSSKNLSDKDKIYYDTLYNLISSGVVDKTHLDIRSNPLPGEKEETEEEEPKIEIKKNTKPEKKGFFGQNA